jgi:hypothetical protein
MLARLADELSSLLGEEATRPRLEAAARALIDGIYVQADTVNSVWHPLGFANVKVPLSSISAVRLHIWPPIGLAPVSTKELVHDHTWDLTSYVVLGRLTNVLLELHDGGDSGVRKNLVEITHEGDVDVLASLRRQVTVRVASASDYGPGDVYQIPARMFHQTHVQARPTATLVVGTERRGRATQVLADEGYFGERVVREAIPPTQLRELIDAVRSLL